ncbi:MAG: type II toxin-antitoxin system VapB family antitoxin [Kineosporiaceae bacterium]|nr:type II toxin-antitoxin system VapB family antitoxin [Kineosporiaceae bacterium]
MGLNIKNPRVHELARTAAERFGMSQTSVIEEALRRMLQAAPARPDQSRLDVIQGVLAQVDVELTADDRAALREDALRMYDDQGLPA